MFYSSSLSGRTPLRTRARSLVLTSSSALLFTGSALADTVSRVSDATVHHRKTGTHTSSAPAAKPAAIQTAPVTAPATPIRTSAASHANVAALSLIPI